MRKMISYQQVIRLCCMFFLFAALIGCSGGATPANTEAGKGSSSTESTGEAAPPPSANAGPSGGNASQNGGKGTEIIPMYSPGSGGTGYILNSGISNIVNGLGVLPGKQLNAEGTSGATEMAQLLIERYEEGKPAIAQLPSDTADAAYRGTLQGVEGAHEELRAIGYLFGVEVYMVVPKNSPVQNYTDLKGKKVGVGAAGSGTAKYNTVLLEYYGLKEGDYTSLPLGYGEVVEGIQNGSIDAGGLAGSTPIAAYTELSQSHDVRLLSLEEPVKSKFLAENPFYAPKVVRAGTYKGLEEDVNVAGFGTVLTTHEDVDEETVYQFTKALMENLEELRKVHPSANMTPETVDDTVSIPFHPGAKRYLAEIGVQVD